MENVIMVENGHQVNRAIPSIIANTKDDLDNLPQNKYNFGALALVIHGTDDKPGLFIADADKEWIAW